MGGKALVVAPTIDPVSLVEAKAHCRVDIPGDDGLLAGYLLAARQHVERVTRRALIAQRWNLYVDRCWPKRWDGACYRTRIVLPLPPLRSIVSVQYVDQNGATQTLAADQYRVIKGGLFGFIEPAFGVAWPAVRSVSDAITVLFECGYGTLPGDIPEPIRQAILLITGHFYENREGVAVGATPSEVPLGVDRLLADYLTEVGA